MTIRGGRTAGSRNGGVVLDEAWRAWLADNMVAGIADSILIATLVGRGVPAEFAAREIARLRAHPLHAPGSRQALIVKRFERRLQLLGSLAALAPGHNAIERREWLGRDEFLTRYYATNRPVILTELMTSWPALKQWSPAYFRATFGALPIEICDGREADPDYDMNARQHAAIMPMNGYVDRVLAADASNDFYLVANNRNLERDGLQSLIADLTPLPPFLDPGRGPGWMSLWFGPCGTVTPLHHDANNILFCQMYGRKHFKLVSPLDTALLHTKRSYYSPLDLELPRVKWAPDYQDVQVYDVELAPGEALFIPVGWWHHVRGLTASISVSLLNFVFDNQPAYYLEG